MESLTGKQKAIAADEQVSTKELVM